MKEADIPSDFINRDLQNLDILQKGLYEILSDLVRVVSPTSGAMVACVGADPVSRYYEKIEL